MTYKSTILSFAAATAIAAMVTGCGSSDSGSSAGTTTTTSSNKAVDGYIVNAKVVGTYFDDKNVSQTTAAYTTTKNTYDVINGKIVSKGDAAYALPESNASVASKIRYRTLTAVPVATDAKGIRTNGTYIDVDGNGDYNLSIDQSFNSTLHAPAGFGPITVVSEMVYQQVKPMLTTAGDVNQTQIDNAAGKIANALGLTLDDVKNVDPTKKPAYAFVNAQLASSSNLAKLGKALVDANTTKATDLKEIFTNLKAAAITASDAGMKTNATSMLQAVEQGVITDTNIATFNPDNTRKVGAPVASTPSTTAFALLTGITNGSNVDLDELVNKGDKYKFTNGIKLSFAGKADANTSGTVDLLIKVASPKASVADTSKNQSLTIKVSGLEIKAVKGAEASLQDLNTSTAKVSYEWFNPDSNTSMVANYVSKTDVDANASGIDLSGLVTKAGDINISSIINVVDKNATEGNTTIYADNNLTDVLTSNIATVQVGLVDAKGILAGYDSSKKLQIALAKTIIAGPKSVVAGNAVALVDNSVMDSRSGAVTGANVAPDNNFTIGNADANSSAAAADTNKSDVTSLPILNNNNKFDMNVTKQTVDTFEKNTTVKFTFGSMLTDLNSSNVAKEIKANNDGNTSNAFELNTTSTTEGNLTTNITMTAADEFGDSNTTTMYVLVNRKPVKTTGTDGNTSWIFNELDAWQDINITGNYVTVRENNGSDLNLTGIYADVNVSSKNVQAKLVRNTSKNKLGIEFNETMPTNIKYGATGTDWNLSISDANITDSQKLEAGFTKDENRTIK